MTRALLVALLLAGCEAPVAPAVDAGRPDAWPHYDSPDCVDLVLGDCPAGTTRRCSVITAYDLGCNRYERPVCNGGTALVVCVPDKDAGCPYCPTPDAL